MGGRVASPLATLRRASVRSSLEALPLPTRSWVTASPNWKPLAVAAAMVRDWRAEMKLRAAWRVWHPETAGSVSSAATARQVETDDWLMPRSFAVPSCVHWGMAASLRLWYLAIA